MNIDPEFRALIPPLRPEELRDLEASILADGCRDALVTWIGILIDGHNRFDICTKHGIEYRTLAIDLPGRDAAKLWIMRNQLGRRNLTDFARAELVLKLKPEIAAEAKERQIRKPIGSVVQNSAEQNQRTRDTLASLAGVSHDTVTKVAAIVDSGNDEVIESVRRGDVSINRAHEEVTGKPHVAHNSGDNEWYTPKEYIEAAREVLGGIDLDPASHADAQAIVKAKRFYIAEDDGLSKKWTGRAWMNPPYASGLVDQFAEKLVKHYKANEVPAAVVLVNNATETRWFQCIASASCGVCLPLGRVKFWHPRKESTPLQGQAVLYLGDDFKAFKKAFRSFGAVARFE